MAVKTSPRWGEPGAVVRGRHGAASEAEPSVDRDDEPGSTGLRRTGSRFREGLTTRASIWITARRRSTAPAIRRERQQPNQGPGAGTAVGDYLSFTPSGGWNPPRSPGVMVFDGEQRRMTQTARSLESLRRLASMYWALAMNRRESAPALRCDTRALEAPDHQQGASSEWPIPGQQAQRPVGQAATR